MKKILTLSAATLAISIAVAGNAVKNTYSDFPITTKAYSGDKTDSVSYTGQSARHALHNSLKVLAGSGNGEANPELEAQMMAYFAGSEDSLAIISPVTKGDFIIKQSTIEEISTGKNLKGKTYGGLINGWPGQMTGDEVIALMIKKAAESDQGYDVINGYDYAQLISKFTMGAVFYSQAVDNYLDERLEANKNPNGTAYKEGTAYTGKEHIWDEAFGYFGAPAHTLTLDAASVYSIAKSDPEVFDQADYNNDGLIDLKSEMTYAHAYYAANADKSGKTDYLNTITSLFIEGRQLITYAKGNNLTTNQRDKLKEIADQIKVEWEKVIAEATFKYAGSVAKDVSALIKAVENNEDVSDLYRTYAKHWGELKGFAMSLETAGKDLGKVGVQINRLIGFSPVLLGDTQVVGIDRDGNFVQATTITMQEYAVNMAKLQQILIKEFAIKAKSNDVTGDMTALLEQVKSAPAAEND